MTPPSDPALDDPLFAPLRARHPDVDIVLLPSRAPTSASEHPEPEASWGQLLITQRHAAAVLDALASEVGSSISTDSAVWWTQDDPGVHRWVVRAHVEGVDGSQAALEVLRRLGNALARLGWDTRPARTGAPRIRALTGPVELVAALSGPGIVLTLTSQALRCPASLLPEWPPPAEDGEES